MKGENGIKEKKQLKDVGTVDSSTAPHYTEGVFCTVSQCKLFFICFGVKSSGSFRTQKVGKKTQNNQPNLNKTQFPTCEESKAHAHRSIWKCCSQLQRMHYPTLFGIKAVFQRDGKMATRWLLP